MRALVIGGSGQIGGWLLKHLTDRGHEVTGTYAEHPFPGLVRLDAADREASAALIRELKPEVVFYPAGFTWVDGCERDPDRARRENLEQPLHLARVSAELGGRFVYFSTDYVFDGQSGPDAEDSPTNPLNEYGRSKLEAEQALDSELGEAQLTLRTSWVFGPERQGKNFAYQVIRTLQAGQELPCPADMASNPSYGPDVALAAVTLAERSVSGLLHVAGPEVICRLDFARDLADGFGLDPALVVPRRTAELSQGAPRPLKGGLKTERLESLAPGLLRSLEEAVDDFRQQIGLPEVPWAKPAVKA